uniref:Uncharacterized protein n=1 Tax=Rhizophora mucronata TaxID=61149 RepID=A0A2P2PZK9_RHIMU
MLMSGSLLPMTGSGLSRGTSGLPRKTMRSSCGRSEIVLTRLGFNYQQLKLDSRT